MEERKIEEILRKAGEQEDIPESLKPENMQKFLEQNAGRSKKKRNIYKWSGVLAAAACLGLFLLVEKGTWNITDRTTEKGTKTAQESGNEKSEAEDMQIAAETYDTSYEELYDYFQKVNRQEQKYQRIYSSEKSEMAAEDSAANTESSSVEGAEATKDYADTNKQEAGVDEGDIVKNDGRYLYQLVQEEDGTESLQIVDTQDGLKELTRISGMDNPFEFYVWNDTLVIMESCWADTEEVDGDEKVLEDVAYHGTTFQKIHIYNITERTNPKQQHVFTVKGSYLDSRITDGYLYLFLNCDVNKLQGRSNYKQYVPVFEGKAMAASSIYLPEEAEGTDYVVMATVDLTQPDKFADTKAIVGRADRVYVTDGNIYVLGNIYDSKNEKDETYSDKTNIIRFSYEKGIFHKAAEGSVKGVLMDDMAINESNDYLRMAVTVDSYKLKRVRDDIFGYFMGYETTDSITNNSVYVLDENLEIVGKIEGLAENEKIYSARFMGDTGYFVTFRQTDPLFSVDLSEPKKPEILGELKISGFSEYLHFYSENLLLGIGMEADENTGRTQGMKLSMFDISNPADVREQDKYDLSDYNYAEALYNYKAVMIDTNKNLFGFYAQGYNEDGSDKQDFLLFSYENGEFQQKMKIACEKQNETYGYYNVRGTYIGEVFYLLRADGRIQSYDLADGSLIETLDEKTES